MDSYATTWYKSRAFRTSTWWTKCGNVLEQSSNLYQDHVLVWLSRLQQVSSEINSQLYTARRSSGQDDDQRELIRLGLISRLRDLHNDMPSQYLTSRKYLFCVSSSKRTRRNPGLTSPLTQRASCFVHDSSTYMQSRASLCGHPAANPQRTTIGCFAHQKSWTLRITCGGF